MDKNMIHIDDLVRKRLSGGEEPLRPGSWQNMRELLDEKMPDQRPAGGGGWGRLARYATVLALLSTFTVGGYQMIRATRTLPGSSGAADASIGTSGAIADAGPGNSRSADAITDGSAPAAGIETTASGNQATASSGSAEPANTSVSRTTADQPGNTGENGEGEGNNNNNHNSNTGRAVTTADARTSGHPAGEGGHTGNGIHAAAGHNAGSAANASRQTNRSGTAGNSRPGTSGQDLVTPGMPDARNTLQPVAPTGSGAVASTASMPLSSRRSGGRSNNATVAPVRHSTAQEAVFAKDNHHHNVVPGSASNGQTLSFARAGEIKSYDTSRFVLKKDTIQQIRITYHYYVDPATGGGAYRTDTLSRTRLIVDRLLSREMMRRQSGEIEEPVAAPASSGGNRRLNRQSRVLPKQMKTLPSAGKTELAPAAPRGLAASAAPSEELVPLDNYKVSSRKGSAWDPKEGVDNLIRNTKLGLSQMRFYSGLLAGINSSIGGGASLNGFHLGLTGLLTFNENWSIMGELKYFQRFNRSGYTIEDNYQTGVSNPNAFNPDVTYTSNGVTYNVYNWKIDSMEHYYKFSSLGSLELPLALRYTRNRFNAFAGVNIVYNFRVNVEEVDYRHPLGGRDTIAMANVPAYVEKMTGIRPASVRFENFDPRLGIGYLLGLAYQVTPAVSIDLRITQTLFDNASSSEGGKKVFKDLYGAPNMQLSIGYRFSQQPRR